MSDNSTPIEKRHIKESVKFSLIAYSAGRCEFRGCNKDLYRHSVTDSAGNFSQNAHIVGFRLDGPRGSDERPKDINGLENFMLLCRDCHHLIDQRPQDYPVSLLKDFKREHEDRIEALTALGPQWRTTVIQVIGTIAGQPVDMPPEQLRSALVPFYPARLPGILIDLTGIQTETQAFFGIARDQIRRDLRPAIRAELAQKNIQHYSVFALAPIPTLICLGYELGNKLSVDIYQRHRNNTWKWNEGAQQSESYKFHQLRKGSDCNCVGLVLSLSGKVSLQSLPTEIDDRYTLWEITLQDTLPNVEFLKSRADLSAFRIVYRDALSFLNAEHGQYDTLHLFPAVPSSIAIACGMDIMPKAHPPLAVYDNVKGKFQYIITTNQGENL